MRSPYILMTVLYRFVWSLLLLCPTLTANCQGAHLSFEHFGTAQGLSHSNVICTLQDSRGFLWFGTREGLDRYDGYTFTVYKAKAGDDKGLGSILVNALVEDDKGYLWIGTWGGGVDRYDRKTDRFVHFKHDPANPASLSSNLVESVMRDSRG